MIRVFVPDTEKAGLVLLGYTRAEIEALIDAADDLYSRSDPPVAVGQGPVVLVFVRPDQEALAEFVDTTFAEAGLPVDHVPASPVPGMS